MEKVLMIANQFPPMGGSGVQRSVKFVKHLRNFGYEPLVFTRELGNMPLRDETLLKDIPPGVEIIRTKPYEAPELKGLLRIPGKVIGKITIPDSARLWMETSKKYAAEIVKSRNIRLIYTTSAPYSDHLLGLYIKRKLPNVKWIVDFRDEWSNNPYTLDNPYNFLRTSIEAKQEMAVLEGCDFLVTNTPVMRENFMKISGTGGENYFVIPNGYDKEDFESMDISSPDNQRFTMVYTGALYGRRKPDTFFQALSELIKENKLPSDGFEIRLIGNYHKDRLQSQIDSFGLTTQIKIVGYVPHNECIRQQLLADALILIEGTGRGAEAFYTGKIFEYMNTGRPVLAILPENGAAAQLVRESRIGVVAHTDNVERIKENILNYYNRWKDGRLDFEPDKEVISRYERKELTKKLAEVFDMAEK